jgi:hypothetical protein
MPALVITQLNERQVSDFKGSGKKREVFLLVNDGVLAAGKNPKPVDPIDI